MSRDPTFSGELLDEATVFSLGELCRTCGVHAEYLMEMIAEGVIEPRGPDPRRWRFTGTAVIRVQTVLRLQRDLGVNLPGAALALDLLEELETLRRRAPDPF